MSDSPTLDQARSAKQEVARLLAGVAPDAAVGITRAAGSEGYAVKVNLRQALADPAQLPGAVQGVPLVVEVVGQVRKLQ